MTAPLPKSENPAADRSAMLSALADGESSALDACCDWWRDDARARRTWHAYHLIGDVLRSEDLAAVPARDAAFVAALRERLAHEPVPIATAAVRRRAGWRVPAAAAAGFAVVAGVVVVLRAQAPVAVAPLAVNATAPALALASSAVPPVASPRVIRDARLDLYLAEHRRMTGSPVLPGGAPRNVEAFAPAGVDTAVVPVAVPVAR